MRRRDVLLALFAMMPIAALAAGGDDPKSIVEAIYKVAAGPKGDYKGKGALDRDADRKRWFSQALYTSYNAALRRQKTAKEPSPAFDIDPVTASQDPSVKNLTIAVEQQDAGSANVVAKFMEEGARAPTLVRYLFKREGGAWKVDDILIPDPQFPFKLSKALKQ